MNLRDLQYVVAVAELQHFGRAADRCHVSQPTLSMQIRKVEDYLGVELFERSGRRVLVTSAGEQIVDKARVLLRDYEELQLTAKRLKDPSAGQYRLGAFPTLAPYLLPRIVPAIHATFPRLRLLLLEDKTEQLLLRLRRGSSIWHCLRCRLRAMISSAVRSSKSPSCLPPAPATLLRGGSRYRWTVWRSTRCCCWTRVIACASKRSISAR